MGQYRVELAKQGRAGCKGTECKKNAIKIEKGDFRMGTLVTIQDHTSWTWKHWGCVTPAQIQNWKESTDDGNLDLVDGYDEIPEEYQAKVKRAFEQGHVDDEDWKGDVEVNRPGQKGFRVKVPKEKTPKKKAKKDAADDLESEAESPAKPAKKRGRTAKVEQDSDEEAPPPKKARGKAKKFKEEAAEDDGEHEAAPTVKKGRASKKAIKAEIKDEADGEEPAPVSKKPRASKKATKASVKDEEDEEELPVEEAPKPKRSKASKKTKADPAESLDEVMADLEEAGVSVKAKRGRKKEEVSSGPVEEGPETSAKSRKGRAASGGAGQEKSIPQKRTKKASKKTTSEN